MVGVEGDDLTQKLVIAMWGLCWYNFLIMLHYIILHSFCVYIIFLFVTY